LRLTPVASPNVQLEMVPIGNIFEFAGDLAVAGAQNELVYSWHDFTARGAAFGRGMMVAGNFAREVSPPFAPPTSRNGRSRLDSARLELLPFSLFNGLTTPVFNHMYHAWLRLGSRRKLISLYEFLFPVHNKEAYFYWFGKKGFHECQIIVDAGRFNSFVNEIQRRLERAGFGPDEVREELDRLQQVGLIDDEAFSRSVVEHSSATRKEGRRVVAGRLISAGIAPDIAEAALDAVVGGEEERADALAAAKAAKLSGLPPDAASRRLYAMLARRGYAPDVAGRAARRALAVEAFED